MSKETGEKLLIDGKEVTAEKTFTAKNASGSIELEFTFDASTLQGTSIVVFETLYHNNLEVAVHADIEDQGQTIDFVDIRIKTTAKDKERGGKEASANKAVTIVDTVEYKDLIVGQEYTVKGILMNKATEEALQVLWQVRR